MTLASAMPDGSGGWKFSVESANDGVVYVSVEDGLAICLIDSLGVPRQGTVYDRRLAERYMALGRALTYREVQSVVEEVELAVKLYSALVA